MTDATTESLRGKSVAVAVAGSVVGTTLAASLAARGARVALLTDDSKSSAAPPAGVKAIPTDYSSRASAATAFAQAEQALGTIDLVVHASLPAVALQSRPLAESSDDQWETGCEATLANTFHCLQAAYDALSRSSGVFIVLGPAMSLTGANGLVALTTASEGQRSLAKSAARHYGQAGIRVNWIGLAPEAISPEFASGDLPKKSEAIPLPLGRKPQLETDVAAMIASLAGEAWKSVTGQTINLDGGEWMLP